MREIIGIFGGTFNPPHLTHIAIANAFLKQLEPKKLYVFPCFLPPHKALESGAPSPKQRLEMTKIAFEPLDNTEVSSFELDNEGSSYTYITVEYLKSIYKDDELCLVMGYDNLFIFEKWRRFEYLLKNCSIAVADRSALESESDAEALNRQVERLRTIYGAKIYILKTEKTAISSTDIRALINAGDSALALIGKEVFDYIKKEGLYGVNDAQRVYPLDEIYDSLSSISKKRLEHIKGTRNAALTLAANHFPALSENRVAAAALLHDSTKELDRNAHLKLCAEYGIELDETERSADKLLHAKTGAYYAKARFGVDDGIFGAILYHTTGKANMTPLEKIIFLADFIEPTRSDPLCSGVRDNYFSLFDSGDEKALDKTLLLALNESIRVLTEEFIAVHPHTIEARNFLLRSLADEGISCGS